MSEHKTIVVMGTMDTKAAELSYLADRIRSMGVSALLMDVGTHRESGSKADIPLSEILAVQGKNAEDIHEMPRGKAVEAVSNAAAQYLQQIISTGKAHGVIGLGGSGGTTICTAAMRELPYGVPKLVITTLASGNTRWHIGNSDIILMPSIMDIGGLNPLLEMVLNNAAGAISGMVKAHQPYHASGKPVVSFTMYGTTTPGVSRTVAEMKAAGYETWVFHASGVGGQTMEKLMRQGHIQAVMDMTLAEIGAHIVGGLHDGGPNRLETAGELGLPQVIVPGAADTIVLPPRDQIPEKFKGRTLNFHNPTMTTMRTTAEENVSIGKFIASKLNAGHGPVVVVLPKGGLSSIDHPGMIFYDPAANQALFDTLKAELSPAIRVIESEHHIDDPEFALLAAKTMQDLVKK